MITVTLYTRAGCHLCEEVKTHLQELHREFPHQLVETDITSDDNLHRAYVEKIPVVEIGPYRKQAPITKIELEVTLRAAMDRLEQLTELGDPRYEARRKRANTVTRSDRITYWFSRRYIWVFNFAVFLYVGLPFLAPVLMQAGITGPANAIYRSYSFVCHTLAFRSWFLFGEQSAYPRTAANMDELMTFNEATGIGETDVWSDRLAARNFVGNEQVGYKVAYCERDVGIYAGILLFGLLFAFTGRRMKSIPWYVWIIIGMGPIGLDGVSQLLSQPPFDTYLSSILSYRESTPFLRTFTGGMFGFMTAWFGYPLVEETMQDARRLMQVKFTRLGKMPK